MHEDVYLMVVALHCCAHSKVKPYQLRKYSEYEACNCDDTDISVYLCVMLCIMRIAERMLRMGYLILKPFASIKSVNQPIRD